MFCSINFLFSLQLILEILRKKILCPRNSHLQRLCSERTLHLLTCEEDCRSGDEIERKIRNYVGEEDEKKKKVTRKKRSRSVASYSRYSLMSFECY